MEKKGEPGELKADARAGAAGGTDGSTSKPCPIGLHSTEPSSTFVNAALQCLAHFPFLSEYFASSEYTHDKILALENVDRCGDGRVTEGLASLLKQMRNTSIPESISNPAATVSSSAFVRLIRELQPELFEDGKDKSADRAAQLLRFLLETLHEDLNRAKSTFSVAKLERCTHTSVRDFATLLQFSN